MLFFFLSFFTSTQFWSYWQCPAHNWWRKTHLRLRWTTGTLQVTCKFLPDWDLNPCGDGLRSYKSLTLTAHSQAPIDFKQLSMTKPITMDRNLATIRWLGVGEKVSLKKKSSARKKILKFNRKNYHQNIRMALH